MLKAGPDSEYQQLVEFLGRQFTEIDGRFTEVDQWFVEMNRRSVQVSHRFTGLEQQFGDLRRVMLELVDGEIVDMTPLGRRHIIVHSRLTALFTRALGDRAIVWPQGALPFPPDTELQPDLVVLRPRADSYANTDPTPSDVLLVVEISDTSLRFDRGEKMRVYARSGIREYGIIDVVGQVLEVFRNPTLEGYAAVRQWSAGSMSPEALPDISVDVADLLR